MTKTPTTPIVPKKIEATLVRAVRSLNKTSEMIDDLLDDVSIGMISPAKTEEYLVKIQKHNEKIIRVIRDIYNPETD